VLNKSCRRNLARMDGEPLFVFLQGLEAFGLLASDEQEEALLGRGLRMMFLSLLLLQLVLLVVVLLLLLMD